MAGNVRRASPQRKRLIHTAMRLFRRQGYAATGLQQILDESEVPKGSLYHHFPGGKEALAEAAVQLAGELVAEMLTGLAVEYAQDPRAFVAAYCRVMAGWMEESGFHSGCPIATTMLETVPESPSMTRIGERVLDSWVEIVAGVFAGAGSSEQQARRRAESLIAAIEGALLLSRIRRSPRPIFEIAEAFEWSR